MSQPLSTGQWVLCAAIALLFTVLFLFFWALTAQYSWSSDNWLMAIPALIVGAGILAIVALAIQFAMRKRGP